MANADFINKLKGGNPFKIPRHIDFTNGVASTTMDGAATFTHQTPHLLRLDPDGSDRTITMYSAVGHNRWHIVYNGGSAGEDITITGVATLNAGEWCWFASDGSAWVVVAQAVGQTLQIDDDVAVLFGSASGGDASISYVSASDDLLIDQITATASTIIKMGSDTSATDFQVQNNSGSPLLDLDGAGTLALALGGAASDIASTSQNLTVRTVTSGTLALTSAGTLDLDGVAVTVDSSGAMTLTAADGQILTIAGGDGSAGLVVSAAGATTLSSESGQDISISAGAATDQINLSGQFARAGSATGTGLVVEQEGTSATEGWQRVIFENTISPAAVETAVVTVPAGSIVEGVWANVESALTGGGTTVTWSLGISGGDLDGFGTATSDNYTTAADALTQNSKFSYVSDGSALSNAGALIGLFSATAQAIVLTGTATGGTAAGDTALTVGSIRIRVMYRTVLPMDNA